MPRLGGFEVSAIGCGDISLAHAARRGLDARDATRAVNQALVLGITLLEVSDDRDSEHMVGDVVRSLSLRDRVVVSTQLAPIVHRIGIPTRDVLTERLPVGYVQERIEASLRATRFDALPLAQLPLQAAWLASPAWPELVGLCARMVHEGKVMQWSARIADPTGFVVIPPPPKLSGILSIVDTLPAVEPPVPVSLLASEPWLVAIHTPMSLCDRGADALLGAGTPVLAQRPLAGGALAGILGPGMKLHPTDERRLIGAAVLERISVILADLIPHLHREPIAAKASVASRGVIERQRRRREPEADSMAELALRYVLDRGAVALPRLHRSEHIPDAVAAASARPLSSALRARLEELFAISSS